MKRVPNRWPYVHPFTWTGVELAKPETEWRCCWTVNHVRCGLPYPSWHAHHRRNPQRPGIPIRLRESILKRDNYTCQMCNVSPGTRPGVQLELDHKKPWSKGGESTEYNLWVLCKACNIQKSDKDFSTLEDDDDG